MSYLPATLSTDPAIGLHTLLGGKVPYLAQLLAGYRRGLTHNPPESGEDIRTALAEENDAYHRGVLLGLLAKSLTQLDRFSSTIGETGELQRAVTEPIQDSLEGPCRALSVVTLTEDLPTARAQAESGVI